MKGEETQEPCPEPANPPAPGGAEECDPARVTSLLPKESCREALILLADCPTEAPEPSSEE